MRNKEVGAPRRYWLHYFLIPHFLLIIPYFSKADQLNTLPRYHENPGNTLLYLHH